MCTDQLGVKRVTPLILGHRVLPHPLVSLARNFGLGQGNVIIWPTNLRIFRYSSVL